ncbi:MAG: hypothetical protein ACHQRM_03430 [Bacteroidia bacterium]
MKESKVSPVTVQLKTEYEAGKTEKLNAYLLDEGGGLVEAVPFKGNTATFKSPRSKFDGRSKVYIAYALPFDFTGNINERTLIKAGGYQTVKNLVGNNLLISNLASTIFNPPIWGNCLITGHVSKNFLIDGQWTNIPLCDLRVHICEVETELEWPYIPIYYQYIPNWVIQEIGQNILDLHLAVQSSLIHPLLPDPGPLLRGQKINRPLSSIGPNAMNTSAKFRKSVSGDSIASALQPLPPDVLDALTLGSIDSRKQAFSDYHDLLIPYICLWPVYWPWIYTYDEDTVVTTDCNGHFEMWENTYSEDGPLNIYIWVEAYINGAWVTVYKPNLPCNTLWNYACGTDININITDARVTPCSCSQEGPGDAFWFRSIGNAGGALHIEQNISNTRTIQGAAFRNVGCTDIIGYDWISPFGGGINLEVFAGQNIYNSGTGVTHFRWKATRIANEQLTPIPLGSQTSVILNAAGKISREYMVHLDTFHYHSFNLDIAPDGSGDNIAFRIPNQDISQEASILAAHPGKVPFVDIFWRDIFWSGSYIDSNSLADGLYRFDLELGKYNGSGTFVVINVDPKTFQISEYGNLDNSQNPTAAYLNMSGPLAKNFTMLVRIDNTHCNAHIHDAVLVETLAKSGACGFIHYTDTNQHVRLSFEATQPRNFAYFVFSVIKGNNTVPTGINPAGYVNTSVGGFVLAGGVYSEDFTVLSLLNGCPGQAAFSENLYVYSIATDGYRRLNEYDAPDVNAFALSNS